MLVASSGGAVLPHPLGGTLTERAFYAPQPIQHDVNTLLDRRSAIGPCELLSNNLVHFLQALIQSPGELISQW